MAEVNLAHTFFLQIKIKSTTLAVIFLVLMLSTVVNAGQIRGTIINSTTGLPLEGAIAEIPVKNMRSSTDSGGQYQLGPIEPGSYNLLFTREGFEPQLRNDVYISGDTEKRVDIQLIPHVRKLSKVTVTASPFRRAPDMAVSSQVMNFDEILRSPGALADVQRAVQQLPSVSSGGDNVNEVIVRGSTPGENLFLMDNIEIPNPNHFAQQGSGGGVVSLVNPLLVQALTFSAGAPPAQHGGKASSVLDVTLRDGNKKMVLGGIDLGIGGLGAHAEGPLWDGASFMASGSKSFLDVVAHFDRSIAIPSFWGMQTKIAHRVGNHKISINGIYGDNNITITDASAELGTRGDVVYAGGYVYAGGLTAKSFWGDKISTTTTLSATGNKFERREYTPEFYQRGLPDFYRNNSLEQEQTFKLRSDITLSGPNKLIFGTHIKQALFDIDLSAHPDTLRNYLDSLDQGSIVRVSGEPVVSTVPYSHQDQAYKFGGFLSAVTYPFGFLKIVPGFRYDGFTYNRTRMVSPRLSAVYSAAPSLDISTAFGIQYQQPDYYQLVSSTSNAALPPKKATTGIAGIEYSHSPWNSKLSVEGYYKEYQNLPVDSSFLGNDSIISRFTRSTALVGTGVGRSYGVELYAKKKLTRHFSGSAAYSYSHVRYKDIRPGHEGIWYPGDFDFRHGFTLTGGWKQELLDYPWYQRLHDKKWFPYISFLSPIADRMELSFRLRYLSGRPYTRPEYFDRFQIWGIRRDAPLNQSRYTAYSSLDLRYERRFGFGLLQMIYYFEVQNLLNRKNIWQYVYTDGKSQRSTIYQLPLFPAGGMIIGF